MTPLTFRDIVERLARCRFRRASMASWASPLGGVVPAALVAQRLGLELKVIALNYRDEANEPRFTEPQLLSAVPDLGLWKRVLLSTTSTSRQELGGRARVAASRRGGAAVCAEREVDFRADPGCRRLCGVALASILTLREPFASRLGVPV